MLARLTDWRTTLLGLALAALIIAALITRPEWDAADLAAFAGAIGTALLGALSRSSASVEERPAAPTVPPVPPLAVLVIACLALVGCARPIDTAIRTTNGARAVGETARAVITAACVPAYRAANTAAQLAAADARCLPAERAYRVYAAAHATAVVAVQRAQLGLVTEADALAAAVAVGQAGGELAAAVQAVTP